MLWIQHLRWCRCSAGSKRKMRAESECACQQEWNEVWNLALNFNCAIISRDVWGPWLGRQDCRELETSAAAGTVRDWLTGPCARGRVGRTGEAEMGSDWDRYSATALHPWKQHAPVPPEKWWRKHWKAIAMVMAGAPGYTLQQPLSIHSSPICVHCEWTGCMLCTGVNEFSIYFYSLYIPSLVTHGLFPNAAAGHNWH